MPQLVSRLRVHPADDLAPFIGEKTFHFTHRDARVHRDAIDVAGQGGPVDGARDVVVMAIALRPFRVVREGGSALVVEKTQKIVDTVGP